MVREMLHASMRDSTTITANDINSIVHQMHVHNTGTSSAAAATTPASSAPVVAAKTKSERLRELRELLDMGEITQSEHDSGRTNIINS
jgi:hypothetical protein